MLFTVQESFVPSFVIGQGSRGVLLGELLQDLIHPDAGILKQGSHKFQHVASRGLVKRALDVLVQVIDELFGLVDVQSNVAVWNSDFGMEKGHVGCVSTDGVEDHFLILEIVCPSVGERLVVISGQAMGGPHGGNLEEGADVLQLGGLV